MTNQTHSWQQICDVLETEKEDVDRASAANAQHLIRQNPSVTLSFRLLHVHRVFVCITELPHGELCSALTPTQREHDKQNVSEFHRQPAAAASHQTLADGEHSNTKHCSTLSCLAWP